MKSNWLNLMKKYSNINRDDIPLEKQQKKFNELV